jgi:hypothetical protein
MGKGKGPAGQVNVNTRFTGGFDKGFTAASTRICLVAPGRQVFRKTKLSEGAFRYRESSA